MAEKTKIIMGTIVGSLVLAVVVFAGYQSSLKVDGRLTLPAGDTYLGPKKEDQPQPKGAEKPRENRFTATEETPWVSYSGKIYPYTFSYPETLKLTSFPNDPSDSVAIDWGGIPVGQNIFLNIEFIKNHDLNLVGKPLEYVQGWWQYFSGLKGVRSVIEFTNSQGLKGYKAAYINQAGKSPNVNVFFEIPDDPSIIIHLANGVLEPKIFERIIDSVQYQP